MINFTLIAVINVENFREFSVAKNFQKPTLPEVNKEIIIGESHKISAIVTRVIQRPENKKYLVYCSGGLDLFRSTVRNSNRWKFFEGSTKSYQALLLTNS